MAKHTLHHQTARVTQARERWDSDDIDLTSLARAGRKLNRASARIARKVQLEEYAYN